MSLLKKLFGGKEERTFQPREPRVFLNETHRVAFTMLEPVGPRQVRLRDVSIGGLSIEQKDVPELKVGDLIKGRVEIDSQSFEVDCEVRHISKGIAGCLLTRPSGDYKRALESYLRVEILGLKLIKVDESYLKPDPAGQVSWFTDSGGSEVYCVHDDEGVVNFHVSFLTNYVQGGRAKKLLCGYIDEGIRKGVNRINAALIKPLDVPSPEMLRLAGVLVQNVEKMPAELKAEIQKLLGAQSG
jgi:hypothetical protein